MPFWAFTHLHSCRCYKIFAKRGKAIMGKNNLRMLAMVLALVLTFGLLAPMTAQASSEEVSTDAVHSYAEFLPRLEQLQGYAEAYAAANTSYNVNQLMLNFLRTGVDRYNDSNWKTLAGEEITAFTNYVQAQDAANGTTVMYLRNLDTFNQPNGDPSDFGHMFGTMNISWVNKGSSDLAGWAGDLCDLVYFSKEYGMVPEGTVEEMTYYVLNNCFGVDAEDAFGMDDFYGDMDAYYLVSQLRNGVKFSTAAAQYFTADLENSQRCAYFIINRFPGVQTQEALREAIYTTYCADLGIQVLEAGRGIVEEDEAMRQACCWAFADYLFDHAGDLQNPEQPEQPPVTTPEATEPPVTTGPSEPEDPIEPEEPANPYYNVFSSTSSMLAPGISQKIDYAITADGKQIVYYVATVDVTRDDVTIMANYRDNDPTKGWGMQRVEDQAKALLANKADVENFNVIVATNGDGYNMSTGKPGGLLIMEGVEHHPIDKDGFFAILKDGSAMIGTQADYEIYKDQLQEAIGGFGAVLIRDGEIVAPASGDRASRTAIGITADGKVVMMVMDGRQEPFSAGGNYAEIAQVMYEAGCVDAVNLDGGGSTTYLSKPEGSDSLKLVNRPSDGYARSVATSLAAVSTAKSSNEFEKANISSEYDYLTIGTSLQLTATGVSNTGNNAEVPANAQWQVSDETIGTITADGVFTAAANGDVTVSLVVDGVTVGEKQLHVVVPDAIASKNDKINAIFGVPAPISLIAYYEEAEVAFNEADIMFFILDESLTNILDETVGTIEGFTYTGNEEKGLRNLNIVAILTNNADFGVNIPVVMYKDGEAVFDFSNITAGDRQLAWIREVSNATTQDNELYTIVDPSQTMEISYVFGLDMESIEIPEQLADLVYMLPGADTGATAWDFLLSLAERVSEHTEVKITVNFDENLKLDISELSIHNDYFYLKSAELDEANNVLTLVCGWIDQTQAIDPAGANPTCILSGVKAVPKDGAAWDEVDRLFVVSEGEVSYRIYLRASSLYSFAQKENNQKTYGLYPYRSEVYTYNGGPESGAYFGTTYATFTDGFTLDKAMLQGWQSKDSQLLYYVDHVALTGVHKLPSYEDPATELYYEFDEKGVCQGAVTGLFWQDGKLCCAMMGEQKFGWQSIMGSDAESYFYYFDPYTGGAVGAGEGWIQVEGFRYYFEDYKCLKGTIVERSGGLQYRFAGVWQRNQWVEYEGNYYYIGHDYFAYTGGLKWARTMAGDTSACHLFGDDGVFQKDRSGFYHDGNDTYLLADGIRQEEPGLVMIDGYYYYFGANAKAVKSRTYWPSKTNGLLPMAPYVFDDQGRITNPPVTEPEEPEIPDTPDTPDTPVDPDVPAKNGIVEENGVLYYYKDNVRQYAAGLLQLEENVYIYVRSDGRLALGKYWVTNANGLLAQGMYDFGTDGKYTKTVEPEEPDAPVEPEQPDVPVKNGIVEENGAFYYYINGGRAYCAGIVEVEPGVFIYVRSNAQLATGRYWPTNTNGLLDQGMYDFGSNGLLILDTTEPDTPTQPDTPEEPEEPETPVVKEGIVEENGILYYYINGTRAYCAGVVKLTDENGVDFYIYVRSNGQLATGVYWPTTTNGLLSPKGYDWGTNGRLYL